MGRDEVFEPWRAIVIHGASEIEVEQIAMNCDVSVFHNPLAQEFMVVQAGTYSVHALCFSPSESV